MSEIAQEILKQITAVYNLLTAGNQRRPLPYRIYKGVTGKFGALRFNLARAYSNENRPEGTIFLDMCATSGPNNYNWETDKITMALSIVDITKIIQFLKKPTSYAPEISTDEQGQKLVLFHDRNAGTPKAGKQTTCLEIRKLKNKDNFFWQLTFKNYDKTTSATVPVSIAETIAVVALLNRAITAALNW